LIVVLAFVAFLLFFALPVIYLSTRGEKAVQYKSILKSDFFYASGLYEVIHGLGISAVDARTVSVGSGNLGDYKLFVIEFDLPDYLNKKIYRVEVGGRFRGLEILSGYVDFRNGNVFDDQDVPDLKDALRRILFKLIRERQIPEEFLGG
jgi:hypothetical protein